MPAEGTSDAFLLPVDVSPKNLKRYGFSLDELYRRLGSLEAQCVTVLLDACFSGAGRTGAMLADVKGVALEPKKAAPTGNMVVLPAYSGSQTAHIFNYNFHRIHVILQPISFIKSVCFFVISAMVHLPSTYTVRIRESILTICMGEYLSSFSAWRRRSRMI